MGEVLTKIAGAFLTVVGVVTSNPALIAGGQALMAAGAAVASALKSVSTPSQPKHTTEEARIRAKKLFGLDTTKINVGVSGQVKAGKSRFINTFHERKPTDPGAAKCGVVVCTTKPAPYPFRDKFRNAVLWDMPGAGEPNNPAATYPYDQCLLAYDVVIVVYDGSIKELDLGLCKIMKDSKIPFFLVRTKCDLDIANGVDDGIPVEDIIGVIKKNATEQLTNAKIQSVAPFCVSNKLDLFPSYDWLSLITALGQTIAANRRPLK